MSEKGMKLLAKKSLIPFAEGKPLNPCDYYLFASSIRFLLVEVLKENQDCQKWFILMFMADRDCGIFYDPVIAHTYNTKKIDLI